MPAVVYLLCGLTGSGKTTYAKRLEAAGAVRLSLDEEVYARHGLYGVTIPCTSTSSASGRWSRSCAMPGRAGRVGPRRGARLRPVAPRRA